MSKNNGTKSRTLRVLELSLIWDNHPPNGVTDQSDSSLPLLFTVTMVPFPDVQLQQPVKKERLSILDTERWALS